MTENTESKAPAKKIVLTAWTVFLWIFRSPTLLTLVVGGCIGFYIGNNFGKASVLPRAVKAEQALLEFKAEITKAVDIAAYKQVFIRDQVRREFDDAQIKLDALNLRLRDLRSDVSLCSTQSTLSIPSTTPGANPEADSGQPRPADVVLQELAAEIARKCDGTTVQLNTLIDWINTTRDSQ